ncbi:MAG: pyruvate dehydrogenase (acetyl-transferring) E1 component subunit alpha [Actinobacteria bacterium]|nr:pyruvate dehydrogenase (acetyl-transferring) E1 component subunit alpha [Actinomycetota bacterium]
MMHIRKFEDKMMDLMSKNIAQGGSHLYAGEEAVAVGAIAAIRPDDYIASTHRGHGHCVAKGGKLNELMAEILGKATGCCGGKGGSLHLADVSTGNLGANGVVAGGLGIATGAALSIKMRKDDKVVICFFGDGAMNEGIVHECMNMASKWELPIIFLVENNLYGMSVAIARSSRLEDHTKRAVAYDMPSSSVDGQDVLAVRDAVATCAQRARDGRGPSMLVANTYRYYGHSRSDPRAYRTREEEAYWHDRDPIKLFSAQCIETGILSENEVKAVDDSTTEDIEQATQFAVDSPMPEASELYTDVYA